MERKEWVKKCPTFTPIRMANIQSNANTKCWWNVGVATGILTRWWESKMVLPLWKTIGPFLTKPNISLPYSPAVVLIIYPKKLKTYVYTKTCMFIATLFVIAKSWKQFRCPSMGEWINTLYYIYTMEYYSVIKKEWFTKPQKDMGKS